MAGYTLEQAQALQDKAMSNKAEWVCSKGCECEHAWVFTPMFQANISGVRQHAVTCTQCCHARDPVLMQTAWPIEE